MISLLFSLDRNCQKAACAQRQASLALTAPPAPQSFILPSLLSRRHFNTQAPSKRSPDGTLHEEKERAPLGHELPAMSHTERKHQTSVVERKRWKSLMQSKGLQKTPNLYIPLKNKNRQTKIKPKCSQSCPVPSPFRDPSHKSTEDRTQGKAETGTGKLANLLPDLGHGLMFWCFC